MQAIACGFHDVLLSLAWLLGAAAPLAALIGLLLLLRLSGQHLATKARSHRAHRQARAYGRAPQ